MTKAKIEEIKLLIDVLYASHQLGRKEQQVIWNKIKSLLELS